MNRDVKIAIVAAVSLLAGTIAIMLCAAAALFLMHKYVWPI